MLQYGICNLGIIPCRAEPGHRSEMVTQLLFGEHFEVIGDEREWVYIRNAYDQYECWIEQKQYLPVSAETFTELNQTAPSYVQDVLQIIIHQESGTSFPVTMGCHLPGFNRGLCNLQGHEYQYDGAAVKPAVFEKQMVVETALLLLNAPYLWGGKTVFGIDCSGLVQLVYKMCGYRMPRDAWQQSSSGSVLSFLEEAEPGDLAFFDNPQGRITHVGIILKDQHILHASGRVRIDKLDHYGIFNEEINDYTHHLRLINSVS